MHSEENISLTGRGNGSSPSMKICEFSAKRRNARFRGKDFARAAGCWMLAEQLAGLPIASAGGDKTTAKLAGGRAARDAGLEAMEKEMARAAAEGGKAEQPAG